MANTCDLAGLEPFTPSTDVPWDAASAHHLHRRLGYGLPPAQLPGVLAADPVAHVAEGIAAAAALPPLPEPEWAYWTQADYTSEQQYADQVTGYRAAWIDDMRDHPWRAKVCAFWTNHFVTGLDKYRCPSWLWAYGDLVQRHAFGDFRDFVRAVGTTPAMLVYLDGVLNAAGDPNENYARELFELFTLGEATGYTQADIREAARALTGYNGYTAPCAPIGYVPARHDAGAKEIFGVSGAFDYDGLVDLLFAERGELVAEHVCRRLYRHFASPDVDEAVVAELAVALRQNDWRLAAVYELLFSSAHFFSRGLRAGRIKDPLELVVGTERTLGTDALRAPAYALAAQFISGNLGQLLFDPPDVAGWPGGRAWVDASRLVLRAQATQSVLFLALDADRLALSAWAKSLVPAGEQRDVDAVTRAVVDFVLPRGLPAADDYASAVAAMRSEVPARYFDEGIWSLDFEYAPEQVALLLDYLMRRPEYQLC